MKKQYKPRLEQHNIYIFDLKYYSSRDKLKKILKKQFNTKEKLRESLYLIIVNGRYVKDRTKSGYLTELSRLMGKACSCSRKYDISTIPFDYGFEDKFISKIVAGVIKNIVSTKQQSINNLAIEDEEK